MTSWVGVSRNWNLWYDIGPKTELFRGLFGALLNGGPPYKTAGALIGGVLVGGFVATYNGYRPPSIADRQASPADVWSDGKPEPQRSVSTVEPDSSCCACPQIKLSNSWKAVPYYH